MYRALVVDDDAAVLQTLKLLFKSRNFDVTTANSASAAIAALGAVQFDVVVTDMRMETNMAGFDVVRSAKALPCPPAVVILSAYPIPIQEWRGAGADAMVVKGGGSFAMIDDIERMLKAYMRTRTAS